MDEQYRPDISLEGLAKLKPIFDNPTAPRAILLV